MKVETGQLRYWKTIPSQSPFLILTPDWLSDAGNPLAWWILTPTGKGWEPNDEIEEHSEIINEAG
jgi:hypothetical protein